VKGTGGLIVPIPNVWKVASTGAGAAFDKPYAARRTIVSNEKCNACHAFLGAAPSYHVGQRNDAPTCSFCHTPNRTSSAWSANAKDFVHAIHAAGVRSENYTWHQLSATEGFWQVTYPRPANNCDACHTAGSYDFSSAAAKAAAPNLLPSTVGTGTYAVGSAHSPYVAEGVAYGSGFSYNTATGATTEAAATTLVVSPVTAACVACHDGELAMAHMAQNGGSFYATRAEAAAETETCLLCHGSGKLADIADMHK
jgi:OmcA/MtrC family decaheme c-type cytochrome